jgi:hypothetical protein
LSTLKREMQRVDAMMRAALLRASQRKVTKTLRHLKLEQTNLNVVVVHEIGKTSSITIMELSDGSHSE